MSAVWRGMILAGAFGWASVDRTCVTMTITLASCISAWIENGLKRKANRFYNVYSEWIQIEVISDLRPHCNHTWNSTDIFERYHTNLFYRQGAKKSFMDHFTSLVGFVHGKWRGDTVPKFATSIVHNHTNAFFQITNCHIILPIQSFTFNLN